MGKHIFQTKEDKLFYNGICILKALKISYNSSADSVTLCNAFDTKDVLIRQAKVADFEVNGLKFNSYNELCGVLNEILYKKGGGEVSGNTGIQQIIYDLNSFNWNVHPDIKVENFYAIKTGKLVTIKAYIEIIQAQDMGRISLLTLPEELRGKSDDTAEYSQVLLVDGYVPVGVPMTTTLRELKYNVSDGYIDLKADSEYDNFNDCNFSFTISYLSEK